MRTLDELKAGALTSNLPAIKRGQNIAAGYRSAMGTQDSPTEHRAVTQRAIEERTEALTLMIEAMARESYGRTSLMFLHAKVRTDSRIPFDLEEWAGHEALIEQVYTEHYG